MQPQNQPPMPMSDDMMGGDSELPPIDGMGQDQMNGNDMMGDGQQNDMFNNHFDAGVEADEEEDPENYIKQLTGKLSQKLRSYNNENGESDESLNKYVAKMVIKAAADGMSPEGRTELKKAVNTAKGADDETEEMPSDGSEEQGMSDDGMGDGMDEPMMECTFTKKTLRETLSNLNGMMNDKTVRKQEKPKKLKPNIYSGYRK